MVTTEIVLFQAPTFVVTFSDPLLSGLRTSASTNKYLEKRKACVLIWQLFELSFLVDGNKPSVLVDGNKPQPKNREIKYHFISTTKMAVGQFCIMYVISVHNNQIILCSFISSVIFTGRCRCT